MGLCLLAKLDHYYLCTHESSHSCVGLMGFYLLAKLLIGFCQLMGLTLLQMFNGVLSASQAFNGALSAGDAV